MRQASEIAAVLFDKDGVFVDFEKTWTPVMFDIVADLAGGDDALRARLLVVAGLDEASRSFLPGSVWAAGHADDLVNVWLPHLNGLEAGELLAIVEARTLQARQQPILPLARQQVIFSDLKRAGFRLGVATNDMTAAAEATVRAFGLAPYFDQILGYDAVDNPKPAGDPVVEFARRVGCEARHVAMVGDNTHDMACARAGGAGLAVGVLSGNAGIAELDSLADVVVPDISHLPALLAAHS